MRAQLIRTLLLLFTSGALAFSPSIYKCTHYGKTVNGSFRPGLVRFMSTENEVTEDETPPAPAVKCPDCDKCDGSGRILGGIPLILPWWPIKPYRPCPNFIARGGNYSRIGQPLDEIAFGRGSANIDEDDDY